MSNATRAAVRFAASLVAGIAGVILTPVAQAASESVVYNFARGLDGFEPVQLVVGNDGNFYGSSYNVPNSVGNAGGVIFRLTPAGALTPLATFWDNRVGQLVKGADGNFYGMTANGGAGKPGILFRLTPAGSLTTLHTFSDADASPLFPPLIQGSDGHLYGATGLGGNSSGTLFRFNRSTGVLTALHAFSGPDGSDPVALVQASGAIYGATTFGGANDDGTIFKLTLSSGAFATLHHFDDAGSAEGLGVLGLIRGADGNFYGATHNGGGSSNSGTIFKVTPAGALSVLHAFQFSSPGRPNPIMQAADGNFYGTLFYPGAYGLGVLYRMNAAGKVVKLHSFGADASDGRSPVGKLVQGPDGNLYGMTAWGGTRFYGTVYKVSDLAADVVEVSPDATQALVTTSQCVWASRFGYDNVAAPFAPMSFQRTGANPGGASTSADGTGIAYHCWAGGNAGDDLVTAASGTLSAQARVYWSKRPVSMSAKGYIEVLPLQQKVTIRPAATLVDVASGAPVAGRTVEFRTVSRQVLLCTAVTGANGTAECKTTLQQNVLTAESRSYTAIFDGDAVYLQKDVEGKLACVGPNCL